MILDAFVPRPRVYYVQAIAALSASAGAGVALWDFAKVGILSEAMITGGSAALLEMVVAGTIAFWIDGSIRVYYMERLARNNEPLPVVQPAPPEGFVPIGTYATETQLSYQPNMVFVKTERGRAVTLHISAVQLRELKDRIRSNRPGLPINGLKTFSSVQAKRLRAEALGHQLAQEHGSMVEWTGEGAVCVLRSSPAPLVSA